ncbi:alpha/beta hydrolase-fold protein [Propionibacteriaceae bacterium Y1923]
MSSPHTRTPIGRLRAALVALAVTSLAAAGAVAAPAQAAPKAQLGPTVVRTDVAPTGHSVTFRYEAPADVTQVRIVGEWWFKDPADVTSLNAGVAHTGADWKPGDILADPWHPLEMTKGDDGVWTFTTPLPSGTFRYAFTHDCTSNCTLIPDPVNPLEVWPHSEATGAVMSRVYVPNSKKFPTYDNDYQAPLAANKTGTLEQRWYSSPLSTSPVGQHDVVVYLPKGYDANRATPYPTLYLSHGGGGNATDWTVEGVAHQILQNAINSGDAQNMVIVSTDFNGLPGGNQGYANELRNNVIPFIEATYNVSTERDDRAFGGLSAGGARALTILYDNPDLFGYVGAWGAATTTTATDAQLEAAKTATGLHLATGLQDYLLDINAHSLARGNQWRAAGIDFTEFNINGMHVHDVWRQMLNHYIRTVAFKATSTEVTSTTTPAGNSGNTKVTATATVTAATTSVHAPTGKVEFYSGDQYLGSSPLKKDGTATYNGVIKGAVGPITARFPGDKLYNASQS